jgi:hypothetical protein
MINLLEDAKREIKGLRQRNEVLEAQVGVVEVFAAALGLKRNKGGAGIDVLWSIQKKIEELQEPKK